MSKNGEFKVDKGFPLPKHRRGKKKYPWAELAVGDSFFVAGKKPGHVHLPYSFREKGWEISTRSESDGIRVWRIK